MNNLSFSRHAEFIMWLIIFMGRCEFNGPVGYELRMAAAGNDVARASLLAIGMLTVILAAPLTRAQDNYEIQVYGSDLVDPGHTMVELNSNFTIRRLEGDHSLLELPANSPFSRWCALP